MFARIYVRNPPGGATYNQTIQNGFVQNVWFPNQNTTRSNNYFNASTVNNVWLAGIEGDIIPALSRNSDGYVVKWNLQTGTGSAGFTNLPAAIANYTSGERQAFLNIVSSVSEFANIKFEQTGDNPNFPNDLLFRISAAPGAISGNNQTTGSTALTAIVEQNRVVNIPSSATPFYYGEIAIKLPSATYISNFYATGDNSQDAYRNAEATAGSYWYQTVVHELGHFLGISHSHNGLFPGVASGSSQAPGTNGLNSVLTTVMSYRNGLPSNAPGAQISQTGYGNQEGGAYTFMALDIAQLQRIYGQNNNHNTGNNTYYLPDSNDTSDGVGPNAGWSCIWDAGGIDTLSAGLNTAAGVVIDLRGATLGPRNDGNAGGYFSYERGVKGGVSIAHDWDGINLNNATGKCVIENAVGGNFNDTIVGNAVANSLSGRDGNDIIYGQAGGDSIFGEEGNDRLYGDQDNDFLRGGLGNDLIDGGAGIDRVSFVDATSAVTVDLRITNLAQAVGGGLGSDLIANVENVLGSNFNDVIYGNNTANQLEGGRGNDTIWAYDGSDRLIGGEGDDAFRGGLGNDYIDGGEGTDKASFADASSSVNVSLKNTDGVAQNVGGRLGTDTLISIEDLFGSLYADTLRGNNGVNTIEANDGNDTLYGEGNNDTLVGMNGADIMYGGTGSDIFVYRATTESTGNNYDRIMDFRAEDKIDLILIDANIRTNVQDKFDYIGQNALTGTPGQIAYHAGFLVADVNGDAVADLKIDISSTGYIPNDSNFLGIV